MLTVALLSSVFTINLFEWQSGINVGEKMIVWSETKNQHTASIFFSNKCKEIYNLNATLIFSCGNKVISEEKFIPYIPKRSTKSFEYNIDPGSIVYAYLRQILLNCLSEPVLVLTIAYTDINNGQEYTICRKYQYSDLKKSNSIVFSDNAALKCTYASISKKVLKAIQNSNCSDIEQATKDYIKNNRLISIY